MEDAEVERLNHIAHHVVSSAFKVHSALGPGLLESVYEACLAYELMQLGLHVEQQKQIPLIYGTVRLDYAYRVDMLVEGAVVVELKAIDELKELHKAQLLSYLKIGNYRIGLLINFNVTHLRTGIRRVVNRL